MFLIGWANEHRSEGAITWPNSSSSEAGQRVASAAGGGLCPGPFPLAFARSGQGAFGRLVERFASVQSCAILLPWNRLASDISRGAHTVHEGDWQPGGCPVGISLIAAWEPFYNGARIGAQGYQGELSSARRVNVEGLA